MDFGAYFFWGGVVFLLIAAWILRYLEADRMAARAHERLARVGARGEWAGRGEEGAARQLRAGAAARRVGMDPVHGVRRGSVQVTVWRRPAAREYALTVNQEHPECRDCVFCLNDAFRWVQQRRAA